MPHFSLDLPLPPSANALWTIRKGGKGLCSTPAYLSWQQVAGQEILVQLPKIEHKALAYGWYRTAIYIPSDARPDADAFAKAAHDLLRRMGMTPDDKWLWGHAVERNPGIKPGRCAVLAWSVMP